MYNLMGHFSFYISPSKQIGHSPLQLNNSRRFRLDLQNLSETDFASPVFHLHLVATSFTWYQWILDLCIKASICTESVTEYAM